MFSEKFFVIVAETNQWGEKTECPPTKRIKEK